MGPRCRVLAVVLAIIAPAGCGREYPSVRPWHQAVYAGECAPDFACYSGVNAALPLLAKTHTDLYLAIPTFRIGDDALKTLLLNAKEAGVGVRAWLLLPMSDGYWPNETNVAAFTDAVNAFIAWSDSEDLGVTWIIADMEPSFDYTRQYASALASGSISTALALLKAHMDPAAYQDAKGQLAALIASIHDRGWKVMAVTYPQVLDDLAGGKETLQDALNIPCAWLDWDSISFMVYLSTFQQFSSSPVGADLIYSYAKDAEKYFGARGGIALGIVGPGGVVESQAAVYESPRDVWRDIGASLAGGIHEVQIYSLEGILALGNAESWLGAGSVPSSVPRRDTSTGLVRGIFAGIVESL